MTVTGETSDSTEYTIRLGKEVDLDNAPSIENELRDALRTPGLQRLVLNMRDVQFFDSSGMGLLISAAGMTRAAAVQFVLQEPTDRVARRLEMMGLLDHFTIESAPK